mgnify:CR=1 FL=1
MSKPNSIMIDNVKYVPEAEIKPAIDVGGMKYAIVRSRNQGVISGFIKSIEGCKVEVLRARQLWRWSSNFVLTDLAQEGPNEKWESKFSCEMSEPLIMLEACGVLYCTDNARDKIINVKSQVNK